MTLPFDRDAALAPGLRRRELLRKLAGTAAAWPAVVALGWFAAILGRSTERPGRAQPRLLVGALRELPVGDRRELRTTSGALVHVTRTGGGSSGHDFVALSDRCPHLGCRVRWEPAPSRFVCACHRATFDSLGRPTGGPPLASRTSLANLPVVVEHDAVWVLLAGTEAGS